MESGWVGGGAEGQELGGRSWEWGGGDITMLEKGPRLMPQGPASLCGLLLPSLGLTFLHL